MRKNYDKVASLAFTLNVQLPDLIMKNQSLIFITLISLLSSCGELTYKRGARPEELERTKRDCQKQSSASSMQQCLRENGWVVQDLDTLDMFVTTSSSDNQGGGIKTAEELTPTQRAELAAPTIRAADRKAASPTVANESASSQPKGLTAVSPSSDKAVPPTVATKPQGAKSAQTTDSKTEASIEATTALASPAPMISPAPDPMDLYKINSWWKIGAGMEANERDIKTCASSLGDGHQPDAKQQLYTRALLMCMKEKGWRALKAAK